MFVMRCLVRGRRDLQPRPPGIARLPSSYTVPAGSGLRRQRGGKSGMWQRLSFALERARRPVGGTRRVHVDDPLAAQRLSAAILEGLVSRRPAPAAVTVLCIGTDRSTGDALGPLVGTRLLDVGCPRARIMGTLDDPVHAANLHQVLEGLQRRAASRDHVVIAVDACLGRTESVGWIAMKPGPLRPGT